MDTFFNGREIRDKILEELRQKIEKSKRQPHLAEILIGADAISEKYVMLKKKMAEKIGIFFSVYKFGEQDDEEDIIECVKLLNFDDEVDGVMVQIPVPAKFDRATLIEAIDPKKDVDGLRFCQKLESDFRPPVVLAIMEALEKSQNSNIEYRISKQSPNFQFLKSKKIVVIGKGFLVGDPLVRVLQEQGINPLVILNGVKNLLKNERSFANSQDDIGNADILISATGKAGLIKPEMAKEDVVLIDAGTAEENGELLGDVDQKCYKKASYYTPVPGGIGPVTVAKLFENLISSFLGRKI